MLGEVTPQSPLQVSGRTGTSTHPAHVQGWLHPSCLGAHMVGLPSGRGWDARQNLDHPQLHTPLLRYFIITLHSEFDK